MKFSSLRFSYDFLIDGNVGYNTKIFPVAGVGVTTPYVIKNVDGLDPPGLDVFITQTINAGSVLQNVRAQNREIVITMKFQPNYSTGETTADLRSALHSWVATRYGWPMSLDILNASNVVLATVKCAVKNFEANPFTKDPQVVITLSCLSPYLSGPDLNYVPGVVSAPTLVANAGFNVTNPADAPSPYFLQCTLTGASGIFTVFNTRGKVFGADYVFLSGDVIKLDTREGSKLATVTRSGVTTNLLRYQSGALSNWDPLYNGLERLGIYTDNGKVLNSFIIYPRYWGV